MTEFVCEALTRKHDRQRFRCGVPELDEWLKRRARQDHERRVAAVYVFMPHEEPTRIAGFYSLCATSILLSELPQELARKLPRYPVVPAILIGRLARDVDFPGLGEKLLVDALQRAWRHSSEIAALAVVVDAKNAAARDFYTRHGFIPIVGALNRLFLPIATLDGLFAR